MEKGHLPLDILTATTTTTTMIITGRWKRMRMRNCDDRQLEDVRDQKTAHLPLSGCVILVAVDTVDSHPPRLSDLRAIKTPSPLSHASSRENGWQCRQPVNALFTCNGPSSIPPLPPLNRLVQSWRISWISWFSLFVGREFFLDIKIVV